MSPLLVSLFAVCEEFNASDIHLAAEVVPRFRIRGALVEKGGYGSFDMTTVDSIAMELGLFTLPVGCPDGTEKIRMILLKHGAIDGAVTAPSGTRYRFNVFRDSGHHAVALRRLDSTFRDFETLGLPSRLSKFCEERDGLFIVTGPTGSGKSTTLATMVDRINCTRNGHIITIEDPIEYQHKTNRCVVNQRQVGRDTVSFNAALMEALRQDPDYILVGEIRDTETIRTALRAAETGHLVLTTLHAGDCVGAVQRLIAAFPMEEQSNVRQQLALSLRGIFAQHLLPIADGSGRVPAYELMVNNSAVSSYISTGRILQMYSAIETGGPYGMNTLDQSLRRLLNQGLITERVAHTMVRDPKCFDWQ